MSRKKTLKRIQHGTQWLLAVGLIGVFAGASSAALIVALNWANDTREAHRWLLALLPFGGFTVGYIYWRWGETAARGNNLLIDEIHAPQQMVQLRMAPMIYIGTFLTHLFGGSAGREGTAVQMGGSLAQLVSKSFQLTGWKSRVALMAGIAGGFGGVFGTPWAGAIFGIEVLAVGWVGWGSVAEGILPCIIASWIGDWVCKLTGVHHTAYPIHDAVSFGASTWMWVVLAGAIFGLIARLFAMTTHTFIHQFKQRLAWAPMRPFVGGAMVALLIWSLHAWEFAGLGVPGIVASFQEKQVWWVWAAKLGLTALTLGAGFKGGEVTPLFFIGAAAGSAMSDVSPLGVSVLAAMGFAAVFSSAANTPIAGFVMAIELFGWRVGLLAGVTCLAAYLCSGPEGIYSSQTPMEARWTQWLKTRFAR